MDECVSVEEGEQKYGDDDANTPFAFDSPPLVVRLSHNFTLN